MTNAETDHSVVQDNGEIWAADKRELGEKISQYYDIENLEWRDEFHDGDGHVSYEVLVYDDDTLVWEGCRGLGHGPSGAVGVDAEYLPPTGMVERFVEGL